MVQVREFVDLKVGTVVNFTVDGIVVLNDGTVRLHYMRNVLEESDAEADMKGEERQKSEAKPEKSGSKKEK